MSMGVYIKGMEMPFAGSIKTIVIYPDGTVRTRRQDPLPCTAVHVPPHGRLVDADALIDGFDPSDFWNPDAEDNCFAAIHVVNCAPTIIPASGGAEEEGE